MRRWIACLIVLASLVACGRPESVSLGGEITAATVTVTATDSPFDYLPVLIRPEPPTATPTPTNTPLPTPTHTATPTMPPPTATSLPVTPHCDIGGPGAPETPVQIVAINKSAETVTIRNVSGAPLDVTGWWICSLTGNQLHAVLNGTLPPNQNTIIPSQAGSLIWNNTNNDPGALFNAQGIQISYWPD